MNKAELIERVAEATGEARSRTAEFVEATFDALQTAMARGEEVAIPGFGRFVARARKARTGRNPQTGAVVKIPATTIPVFRAGRVLKDLVSGKAKLTVTSAGRAGGRATAKKSSAKKATAKKSSAKKATAKKSSAKKSSAKKTGAKRSSAKSRGSRR